MSWNVELKRGEGRWWVARFRERPEVLTQGRTVSSALRNLADAFDEMRKDGETTPPAVEE